MLKQMKQLIRAHRFSPSFTLDNAYDPDVKASQLHIDLKTIANPESEGEGDLVMTFTDNGNGMTPDKLYKMLRLVIIDFLIPGRNFRFPWLSWYVN